MNIANKKCVRCRKCLGTRNITYRADAYYHIVCWDEGERELKRANDIAARFGFPPSNWQGNPVFWPRKE